MDHPRSRGVYPHPRRTRCVCAGSSPLARGLLDTGPQQVGADRIIPARAGFTSLGHARYLRTQDHPRSRGVYCGGPDCPRKEAGSSPLARGLPSYVVPAISGGGIIPARAGFTTSDLSTSRTTKDHPRSRGVYVGELVPVLGGEGSSPLARGLLGAGLEEGLLERIIPARAGFTSRRPSQRRSQQDHPRSRGVYPGGGEYLPFSQGSSPLARGLPFMARAGAVNGRIIPARAGFTCRLGKPC